MIADIHFTSLIINLLGIPKHGYLIATFIPIWSGLAYIYRGILNESLTRILIKVKPIYC